MRERQIQVRWAISELCVAIRLPIMYGPVAMAEYQQRCHRNLPQIHIQSQLQNTDSIVKEIFFKYISNCSRTKYQQRCHQNLPKIHIESELLNICTTTSFAIKIFTTYSCRIHCQIYLLQIHNTDNGTLHYQQHRRQSHLKNKDLWPRLQTIKSIESQFNTVISLSMKYEKGRLLSPTFKIIYPLLASQPMSYNDLSFEHSGGRAKFCNNSPAGLTLNALNYNSSS